MPLISIITAVHAPGAAFLSETITSVRRQELPGGWDLEWLVQEDGADPCLESHFADVPFAAYEPNGAQLSIAETRNLALTRARGDLVQVLDSDDVLLPGALSALIPLFDDDRIHWAVGQADDLLPSGERKSFESALPYGMIPAGQVNSWAEAHGGNWPVHCAGLAMRTTSLRALGGWIGLPSDEDIAMFAALSEMSDGYNFDGVTWLYRQHPQQITRAARTRNLGEHCRRMALQRVKAMRLMNVQFGERRATGFGHDTHSVDVGPAAKVQPGI
ncbi:hypothetical protein GCM10022247_21890 [Allokutzneria multivorans]|uniref:Glycosyltransferase 2-like domain-containing protein n=1 Tax=Allokutzneria multivorans TaxID=1142134 RepID=A0ABP7RR22_9PSEU